MTEKKTADKPVRKQANLTYGFDIGIASVGWCVLGEGRVIGLGVRCFDKAETIKGEPLNKIRRDARLTRRRLRRRAWRLTKLSRFLKREGLIADIAQLKTPSIPSKTPWQLRVEGLDRKLLPEEWARVLYHLVKHRGFHWFSKAEEKKAEEGTSGEGGRVKQALAGTRKLMEEKRYRSLAEMLVAEFPDAQRNKRGEYDKALPRALLSEELVLLFKRQRIFGNPHASTKVETFILGDAERRGGLFWTQNPPLSGTDLLQMLGKCTFEKSEFRAPKSSFTAERHVWLTRLNNLRIEVDGSIRQLSEAERMVAIPLPYKSGELTYKQLKSELIKSGLLTEHFKFSGLQYPTPQDSLKKTKDPESAHLVKLPAWKELRSTLKEKGLETEWQGLAGAALSGDPQLLDQVAWVLSVFKDGAEVEQELRKLTLPGGEAMIAALTEVSFEKFHALSFKALLKIVPYMEIGLRYDQACEKAGYHHSQLFKSGGGQHQYLPSFYQGRNENGSMALRDDDNIPRNPVVLRALNQARKVLNALVREYGSPSAVHIEMARDLSRPFDEREKIRKAQEEFRNHNQAIRAKFRETFGFDPNGRQFEQYQLYEEQHGKCVYSLMPLDIGRVLHEAGYVEIDHALPYSRSFDDSKSNKVLVLSSENRNKGNQTPYEYLTSFEGGENGERWRNFVAFVESNKSYRVAKRSRLLRKDFGNEASVEFKERNLSDTRYICRFFKSYVESHLRFAEGSSSKRCVVINGQLTAFLRKRWGFNKVREESDRHHALDATVVAACGHDLVMRLANYSRRKELERAGNVIDMETGEVVNVEMLAKLDNDFPRPWPHFRDEVLLRIYEDNPALLKAEAKRFGYPKEAIDALRSLVVSRAPQRRNHGALHEATLRSPRLIDKGKSLVRVDIRNLNPAQLDRIAGASDPRNKGLIDALRLRLEAHNGDGKKAFATPIFRPSKEGTDAPRIRTVKILTTQNTGAFIGNAIADLGEMMRVDVFQSKKKYLLVPVYGIPESRRVNPGKIPQDAMFLFSLTKNDLVEVVLSGKTTRGYFVMYESDGRMTLRAHDQPKPDKSYFRRSVGNAERISKLNVDVLGNVYTSQSEKRCGLA